MMRGNSPNNGRFIFFREFLKHPLQIGSIIPSSRFLERRILEAAAVASARTIVELGAGTGGVTRAILRSMPRDATLLSVEINPHFHSLVSSIADDRLIAHLGTACALQEIVALHGLGPVDAVISGIPFSTMNDRDGSRVIEAIATLLAPDGRFVAYQLSRRVAILGRPLLGPAQTVMEVRNIPPMRVYWWRKNGA
ncbi:MAG TPA: methyltransferase domain-containing protein [Geopsychrobacteraceae bacterium]|jgi:phospholipid N-methyltransferase